MLEAELETEELTELLEVEVTTGTELEVEELIELLDTEELTELLEVEELMGLLEVDIEDEVALVEV